MGDREYIAKLKAENQELLVENEQLRSALAITSPLPEQWRLTPTEEAIARVLIKRDFASYAALNVMAYGDNPNPVPSNNIKVHICKIKKKLKPFGIEITNVWGRGYSLDPATRARLGA